MMATNLGTPIKITLVRGKIKRIRGMTCGKGLNSLIPPAMGYIVLILLFDKNAFDIK